MFDSFSTPWTIDWQAFLSIGFLRQEYWNGLPFPSPEDLSNLGIKPKSPALANRFFTTESSGKPEDWSVLSNIQTWENNKIASDNRAVTVWTLTALMKVLLILGKWRVLTCRILSVGPVCVKWHLLTFLSWLLANTVLGVMRILNVNWHTEL